MAHHASLMITGGAGFIGSALVAHAVQAGSHVVVVDKLTYAGHPDNLRWIDAMGWSGSYTLEVADILDTPRMLALMQTHAVSAVMHAAAESHVDNSIASAKPFIETNVVGTQSMLDASRRHISTLDDAARARFRYLQISTDEVYGALGATGHFKLSSPLAPNSPYAASKAAADLMVNAWRTTYGLPTLITRCCNNYGPRQHPEKLIPRMITNALSGNPLPVYGKGDQVREWIHVEDHARGAFAVLERAEIGSVTHLGSGIEHTNLHIVHAICGALAQKKGGDYAGLITHVQDRLGHDFRYALDVSPTKAALGFEATIGFESGLANTIDWYLAHADWIETITTYTHEKRSQP